MEGGISYSTPRTSESGARFKCVEVRLHQVTCGHGKHCPKGRSFYSQFPRNRGPGVPRGAGGEAPSWGRSRRSEQKARVGDSSVVFEGRKG